MRATSATYKALRAAAGSYYEVRVLRGVVTYGMRQIMDLTIHQSLLGAETGPAIGGTPSTICNLVVKEQSANWPRMATFEVQFRLCSEDGETMSEWLSFGTYWTDQRRDAKFGDLSIVAYDGMLRLKKYWTDNIPDEHVPASWPITAAAAGQLLQEATGIQLDARSTLDDTVAWVGLDTMATAKDVWSDIVAAQGCNAVMTPDGKIRLVPLRNEPDSAIAGIAVAGVAIVGSTGPSTADSVSLGLAMRKLDTSPELQPVSGVELTDDAGRIASAGTSSGYTIKGHCSFSNSAVSIICLNALAGYKYRPFSVCDVDLDPAVEPGDFAIIDGATYQIMKIDWYIGAWITADLSAPVEYEIDHEYNVAPENAVTLRRALEADAKLDTQLRSYIQQTASSILQGVAAQYVSDSDLQTVVNQLQAEIDGAIETFTGSAVPTLGTYPANAWTTTEEKAKHIGDLYMVNSSGGAYAGFYYRFELNGSTYGWTLLKDTEITQALADAQEANQRAAAAQQTANALQQTLNDEYSPTSVINALFATKEENADTRAALQSEIALSESSMTVAMSELRGDVDDEFAAMAYYIRYENGVVIIGRTDNPTSIRISNTQVGIYYGNDVISYWNANKQLSPKQLEIPVGGSLRLGDVTWQPRSSGNLSLMWVGETGI
ncbi:MAG: hypothetical protein Q4E45_02200 [Eubacteriales bacterium]|nr:hypothetical protein [Eubacteriales bacterium]